MFQIVGRKKQNEGLSQYVAITLSACEYLLSLNESSKLWSAFEKLDTLIDFLNVYKELSFFQKKINNNMIRIDKYRENTYQLFNKVVKKCESILSSGSKIDPSIRQNRENALSYLTFKSKLNSVEFSDRETVFSNVMSEFEKRLPAFEKRPFDGLLKNAEDEMEKKYNISKYELHKYLFRLSYCDRAILQDRGIFRINQFKRHLVFSDKDAYKDSISNGIYETLSLDQYLFLRDLRMNFLRKFGRFIPLKYNHLMIKFYHEPMYWRNKHIWLEDIDYLRLGFAHYQYAMELGKNNVYTRINYKKSLDCFKKSKIYLPSELRDELW